MSQTQFAVTKSAISTCTCAAASSNIANFIFTQYNDKSIRYGYDTIELTNATMLKLGLTVLLDGSEVSVGCEPEWVKVANGGERARETEAKLALQ